MRNENGTSGERTKKTRNVALLIAVLSTLVGVGTRFVAFCGEKSPINDRRLELSSRVSNADWSTSGLVAGERRTFDVEGVEYAFRWAPSGIFSMGSPENEEGRESGEKMRDVELTRGFWILETETTQEMWKSICNDNPSEFKGERRPVDSVGRAEIALFLQKWSEQANAPQGIRVALPTEAQWEYAARAGSSEPFSGGNAEEIAWFGDKKNGGTHNVAMKKPNFWGLYDMSGNLWEWCSDLFDDYPTDADGNALAVVDPTGATPEQCPGGIRVDRGGCWDSEARECRNANRGFYDGERKGPYVGFRFVINVE